MNVIRPLNFHALGGVYTTTLYEYSDFSDRFHPKDAAFTRSHFISGSLYDYARGMWACRFWQALEVQYDVL